jgi:predicted enzyme related to lactoylglutathione lyase
LHYKEYFVDDSYAVLVPETNEAPPLVLQGVPEPRVGKNRMHLDIVVDDIEPEIERLQALGAHRLDEGHQHFGETLRWVRMSDPEHNEFCVCTGVEW